MSDIFHTLEQDFTTYVNSINKKISNLSNQSNEKKEAAIYEADYELKEAEKRIKQMELEVLPLPEQMRREFSTKVRRYKGEYDTVKKKFKQCEDEYLQQKQKEKLMGARFEEEDFEYNTRPGSLMEQQNRKLLDARKTGYATVELAAGTNAELARQTETLSRNKDRLKQMNGDLGESNALINSMQRRVKRNKMILYGVLGIIALAVILIVWSYL